MSPLGDGSGATSSTGSYHPGYTSDVTSTETIIPTPSPLYSQSTTFPWNDRMPGYQSNPRIPSLVYVLFYFWFPLGAMNCKANLLYKPKGCHLQTSPDMEPRFRTAVVLLGGTITPRHMP